MDTLYVLYLLLMYSIVWVNTVASTSEA